MKNKQDLIFRLNIYEQIKKEKQEELKEITKIIDTMSINIDIYRKEIERLEGRK